MQHLSAKIGVQTKPVFQSKKISQVLSPKEKKPQLQTISAWSINVICATQIMSGTQPDTCTNALASINILQLEGTWKTMAYRSPI